MPSDLTPNERSMRGRMAAHVSWANTSDPAGRMAPAHAAAAARFERQVDPDGVLPPDERRRRAEHARKAYFTELALRSAQARRRNSKRGRADAELASELRAAAEELAGGDAA